MSAKNILANSLAKQMICRRCGHVWSYKGANSFVCSCPHCRTSL